jgi:hypothetical protein
MSGLVSGAGRGRVHGVTKELDQACARDIYSLRLRYRPIKRPEITRTQAQQYYRAQFDSLLIYIY